MSRYAKVDTWVFDLDNTLYNAEASIFRQFGKKETELLARLYANDTGVDTDAKKREYAQKYGSTMLGLQADGLLTPKEFLDFVHDVDLSTLEPCLFTRAQVEKLTGRKIVFTNGPRFFADAVMRRLQIDDLFEAVHTIEDANYMPKPHHDTYASFVERHKINPATACMIEDSLANLKPAYALGMVTVWLHGKPSAQKPEKPDFVDQDVENLKGWFEGLISN